METSLKKYIGIHPGKILERELKKRNLKKGPFAITLQEYPQTLNEITKGRRGIGPSLSLKIDRALVIEEGTMYMLQAHYDLEKAKSKVEARKHPDFSILRKALFWDTNMENIDWIKQYRAVIQRVFERGNDKEKAEIQRFYGKGKIKEVTGRTGIQDNTLPVLPHKSK